MAVKRFNISLDERLLAELDRAAAQEYTSRSEFIRALVAHHLLSIQYATKAEAVSDEQLKAAYDLLRKERARRLARVEIKRIRREGH